MLVSDMEMSAMHKKRAVPDIVREYRTPVWLRASSEAGQGLATGVRNRPRGADAAWRAPGPVAPGHEAGPVRAGGTDGPVGG